MTTLPWTHSASWPWTYGHWIPPMWCTSLDDGKAHTIICHITWIRFLLKEWQISIACSTSTSRSIENIVRWWGWTSKGIPSEHLEVQSLLHLLLSKSRKITLSTEAMALLYFEFRESFFIAEDHWNLHPTMTQCMRSSIFMTHKLLLNIATIKMWAWTWIHYASFKELFSTIINMQPSISMHMRFCKVTTPKMMFVSIFAPGSDHRCYNLLTADEVAVILPSDANPEKKFTRYCALSTARRHSDY